jgi:hypothetical protein
MHIGSFLVVDSKAASRLAERTPSLSQLAPLAIGE